MGKYLTPFLIGVLLGLFILIVYYSNDLANVIPERVINFWAAIGTTSASSVALVVATWGEWLKSKGMPKPNIMYLSRLGNTQEDRHRVQQWYTRLVFWNNSEVTAEDVDATIVELKDNGIVRQSFIPVPLTWTHSGAFLADIHPYQQKMIDLCRINNINDPNSLPHIVLNAGAGIPDYEDIRSGITTLKIYLYQKTAKLQGFECSLTWKTGDKSVQVQNTISL